MTDDVFISFWSLIFIFIFFKASFSMEIGGCKLGCKKPPSLLNDKEAWADTSWESRHSPGSVKVYRERNKGGHLVHSLTAETQKFLSDPNKRSPSKKKASFKRAQIPHIICGQK